MRDVNACGTVLKDGRGARKTAARGTNATMPRPGCRGEVPAKLPGDEAQERSTHGTQGNGYLRRQEERQRRDRRQGRPQGPPGQGRRGRDDQPLRLQHPALHRLRGLHHADGQHRDGQAEGVQGLRPQGQGRRRRPRHRAAHLQRRDHRRPDLRPSPQLHVPALRAAFPGLRALLPQGDRRGQGGPAHRGRPDRRRRLHARLAAAGPRGHPGFHVHHVHHPGGPHDAPARRPSRQHPDRRQRRPARARQGDGRAHLGGHGDPGRGPQVARRPQRRRLPALPLQPGLPRRQALGRRGVPV